MAVSKMNGMPEWHTCHVKKKHMQVWPGCPENERHVTVIKTLNKNLHRHPSNGNIVKNDITFFMWLMGQKESAPWDEKLPQCYILGRSFHGATEYMDIGYVI